MCRRDGGCAATIRRPCFSFKNPHKVSLKLSSSFSVLLPIPFQITLKRYNGRIERLAAMGIRRQLAYDLISGNEERNYRLSGRSTLQCLATVPVVGLQNYIRPYNFLIEPGPLTYFSRYEIGSAPLRNAQLANAIKHDGLLEDQRYTVFKILANSGFEQIECRRNQRCYILLVAWIVTTWLAFGSLLVGSCFIPQTTWVSMCIYAIFVGWSISVRLIERSKLKPASVSENSVTNPQSPDAVSILGRKNSACV